MYEISPYATFSVGGNNSRSVTTSTLDYTMQFKTFGHLEDEDAVVYPKNASGKHNWHKHRYYSNDGKYDYKYFLTSQHLNCQNFCKSVCPIYTIPNYRVKNGVFPISLKFSQI